MKKIADWLYLLSIVLGLRSRNQQQKHIFSVENTLSPTPSCFTCFWCNLACWTVCPGKLASCASSVLVWWLFQSKKDLHLERKWENGRANERERLDEGGAAPRREDSCFCPCHQVFLSPVFFVTRYFLSPGIFRHQVFFVPRYFLSPGGPGNFLPWQLPGSSI